MNKITTHLLFMLLIGLLAGTTACVSTRSLPIIDGRETVAMVNGEPITREEYQQEISSLHAKMMQQEGQDQTQEGDTSGEKKPGKIDYADLLQRMINVRLVVQEAKRIGLNELPDVKNEMENYSRQALRTLLMKRAVKDVQPDEKRIGDLYERSVREWKFASVMFPKEADAKQMEKAIASGENFSVLAHKAQAEKKARRSLDEGFLSGDKIYPQIYDVLLTLGTGSVSPVIAVPGGYALVKLEEARLQETPEKKEEATEVALREAKAGASLEFIEALKKKIVSTDTTLLDSIDIGASKEEFDKLLKDERVITVIGGSEKVTVADLAAAIQRAYFHGVERMLAKEDMQNKKYEVLDKLVEKKMLVQEAINEGIDKSYEYTVLVNTRENALLFGMFVQKVVLPDLEVMESEVRSYYDEHRSDYTSPEEMKLDSVVFKNRTDAEEALKKLRAGDQISWIKANAGGQVEEDADKEDLLVLDGNVVSTAKLPEGLRTALVGATDGSSVLYESPEGHFYAVSVVSVYPSKTEDYRSVRELIAKQLYNDHMRSGLDDWIEKLKKPASVQVYLKY
jgi:hypothetical protein